MKIVSLKQYKEQKSLTNKDLAQLLGISEIYTLLLVSEKRVPGRKLAQRISAITGIPPMKLLYPDGEEARTSQ